MNDWITWAIQGLTAAVMGVITWFWKRDRESIDNRFEAQHQVDEKQNARIEQLEKEFKQLPFIYTTREDFIRATTSIENKLDKIYDLVAADRQRERT